MAALLALFAVVAVFVLPAFDMPDTALRAKALAQLIVLLLVAMASVLVGTMSTPQVATGAIALHDGSPALSPPTVLALPLLC